MNDQPRGERVGRSQAGSGTDGRAAVRGRQVAVIDPRALERDCLVRCLQTYSADMVVRGFGSTDDWEREGRSSGDDQVVLFNIGGASLTDDATQGALRTLVGRAAPHPVIVMSPAEDMESMMLAVECGAMGFIPSSVRFEDMVEATRMTASGCIFLPRQSLMSMRSSMTVKAEPKSALEAQFTDRQLEVARALQKGLANKTIAYELNLCESTVKVHIRNIMRKLQATNRTQAAFKLSSMG